MLVERIEREVLELIELTQVEQSRMHSLSYICQSTGANLEAAKIWMINGEICA